MIITINRAILEQPFNMNYLHFEKTLDIKQFLDKDIWVFLGKYQYSLYVIHYVIIRIFGLSLWKNQSEFVHIHPILPVIIMLFVILTGGVLTYHFIESPSAKYLKNTKYLKNKFLS